MREGEKEKGEKGKREKRGEKKGGGRREGRCCTGEASGAETGRAARWPDVGQAVAYAVSPSIELRAQAAELFHRRPRVISHWDAFEKPLGGLIVFGRHDGPQS